MSQLRKGKIILILFMICEKAKYFYVIELNKGV